MRQIQITSVTSTTLPYNLFACDVYGNQCVLIATVNTSIPPPILITLPTQFNNAPALGLKLIDSLGCEKFGVIYCDDKGKIYQDGDIFIFMDANFYIFENQ
jgi:hypothetical protein